MTSPVDGATHKQSLRAVPVKSVRVRVTTGPDTGAEHTVGEGGLSIGTAVNNDLVLSDPMVSRIHAVLERRGADVVLRDHGSTNGTRVGPVRIQGASVTLTPPATISLGATQLVLDEGQDYVLQGRGPDAFGELLGLSLIHI